MIVYEFLSFMAMKKILMSFLFLSGCSHHTDRHGYYALDIEKASQKLVRGQDTKETIIEKLGYPTIIDSLDNNIWIYASQKSKVSPLHEVKVLNTHLLRLHFDQSNYLIQIEKINPDSKNIDFDKTSTPSQGYSEGVMRDIFGNIGKYSFKQ